MKVAERDKVKELVHHVPRCAQLSGKNTRLHLHAVDLSRCTDRNSAGEESEGRIEVHLGQDGRWRISALNFG